MGDKTKIEWTDATWNPIVGCSVVSPGCANCYAMRLAGTRMKHHPSRKGLTKPSKAGPVWNGQVRFMEQWLDQPLHWHRRRRIFVCAHGDLFHESVPDEWIDRVFAVMALADRHVFQVLTKRPQRMQQYMAGITPGQCVRLEAMRDAFIEGQAPCSYFWRTDEVPWIWQTVELVLPNVWLGVSVEDQPRAEERIPHLLDTPAAVRWVSAEPLLGPIDVTRYLELRLLDDDRLDSPGLDWVVAGGESGPGSRPMHPDWPRSLRNQCAAAGVPFFFKQWGDWVSVSAVEGPGDHYSFPDGATVRRTGKKAAGRTLDGLLHDLSPGRC